MTIRAQGDGTYEEEVRMVSSGAQKAVAITPNDTTDLAEEGSKADTGGQQNTVKDSFSLR